MAKYRHLVTIKNDAGVVTWADYVPVHDAKSAVDVEIGQLDCELGKKYDINGCAHALGIRRHGKEFPHAVWGALAYYTVVYIVDRIKDGKPSHLVRYVIGEGDTERAKANDLALGATTGILHLLAPPEGRKLGRPRTRNSERAPHKGKGKAPAYLHKAKRNTKYGPPRDARLVGLKGFVVGR